LNENKETNSEIMIEKDNNETKYLDEHIVKWLKDGEFIEFREYFANNEIDWEILLSMSEDNLKKIGIPPDSAHKMALLLNKLNNTK
jgi:hypothetical protein